MTANRVAHFDLVEKIGEGGMGQVWVADDLRLKRRVALKLLRGVDSARGEMKMRFTREARAAAALNHPNICTVFEAGESEDGVPFISMELLRGDSLRQRIAQGPIHPTAAADIGAKIGEALRTAHAAGVLHRDIKPGNVMLTDDGRVKVLDFGLAHITEDSESVDEETALKTASGMVMGTPSYMSPEQALGRRVDDRSDVFSLGVVLFEMVTGQRPFDGATATETLHRVIDANPVSVRSLDHNVPAHFEAIISRCLLKKPEERWTAAELTGALRRFAQPQVVREPGFRRRFSILAASVAILAAVAAGAWFARTRRPAAPPVAASATATPAPLATRSVTLAVLPLENIGAEPESEYFADGVTEEIINALAEVRGLHVVSRTSAFVFKGAHTDVREVGRKLGVENVVEGSVRRAGDHVRISVHLSSVADGVQLWSDTYDRDLKDIFAVQGEIAHSVASALDIRLRPGSSVARTVDSAVYLDYLKGRHYLNGMGEADLQRAVEILEDVTKRAPEFAPGFASLADAYLWLEHNGRTNADHAYNAGLAAARRAVELDPSYGDGYAALAHGLAHQGKMEEALAAADRAIELSPSSAIAAQWRLLPLQQLERDGIVEQARIAVSLDPLSVQTQGFAGLALLEAGAYPPAIDCLTKAAELAPSNSWNLQILAMAYALAGRRDAAFRILDQAEKGSSADHLVDVRARRGMVLAVFGDPTARQVLASIDTTGASGSLLKQLARGWAAAGDTDRAIETLERMFRENPRYATVNSYLARHPAFEKVRSDPRYNALRAKYGLPPVHVNGR